MFFTASEKNTNSRDKFSLIVKNESVIFKKLTFLIITSQLRALVVNFRRTNNLLIKFPDIIPVTFILILKNLQKIRKNS